MSIIYQHRPHWCGLASIQAAAHCFGIYKSQGYLRRLVDCNPDAGTDEVEMQRGLLALGLDVDILDRALECDAKAWLNMHLQLHGPAILCVDSHDHWVCCLGKAGPIYTVWDPARDEGLRTYDWPALAERWCLSKISGGPNFYGLGIAKGGAR